MMAIGKNKIKVSSCICLILLVVILVALIVIRKSLQEQNNSLEERRIEAQQALADFNWDDKTIRAVTFVTSFGQFEITNQQSITELPSDHFVLIPGKIPINKDNAINEIINAELIPLELILDKISEAHKP